MNASKSLHLSPRRPRRPSILVSFKNLEASIAASTSLAEATTHVPWTNCFAVPPIQEKCNHTISQEHITAPWLALWTSKNISITCICCFPIQRVCPAHHFIDMFSLLNAWKIIESSNQGGSYCMIFSITFTILILKPSDFDTLHSRLLFRLQLQGSNYLLKSFGLLFLGCVFLLFVFFVEGILDPFRVDECVSKNGHFSHPCICPKCPVARYEAPTWSRSRNTLGRAW